MKTEILTVGTEILLGQIIDSNSSYIAQELLANGIDLYGVSTVGDNLYRIVDAIRYSLSKCDALIVTGGLGPTQDDITRNAVAMVMGVDLVENKYLKDLISKFFADRNRPMPENNLLQAMVPEGAEFIEQKLGTAPGLICPVGNKVIYCLPGVPYEMKEMLNRSVIPDILGKAQLTKHMKFVTVATWGLSESRVAELLSDEFNRLESMQKEGREYIPSIAFLANISTGIKIRVSLSGEDEIKVNEILRDEVDRVASVLGESVFSTDSETLEQVIHRICTEKGITIGLVESLTGGMIASRIVDVPGASKYFKGSIVAYDTDIKRSILKIQASEVVSEAAVIEMAKSGLELLSCDICLSISGVGGPEKQEGKDPGTVYIGLAADTAKFSKVNLNPVELKLYGSRDTIRQMATTSALDLLRRRLTHF